LVDEDPGAGTFFTGGVPSLLFCFEDSVPLLYKRLKTGLGVVLGRVDRIFGGLSTAWAAPAVRAAALAGFLLLEDRVCVLYKRSKTEPALALGVGTLASRLAAAVFDVRDDSTTAMIVRSLRVVVWLLLLLLFVSIIYRCWIGKKVVFVRF
jgi:hypothetical protein